MKLSRKVITKSIALFLFLALGCYLVHYYYCRPKYDAAYNKIKVGDFWVVELPTPNIGKGTNRVQGVVLHHTACRTINDAIGALCSSKTDVSAHALIDKDGTRYILAEPEQVTWHAGYSVLNGRNWCNNFTIGIEFQGNTKKEPLTEKQIDSAIDYLIPIIKKYCIKKENIVTHEFIRKEWNKRHPDKKHAEKVDITKEEYVHFMKRLEERL